MRVCEELVIPAPVGSVFEMLAAPTDVERWNPAVAHSQVGRADGEEPERVVIRARGGRRWRERLVERVDSERVVWEVADGLRFPLRALRSEWSLEPAGAATRVIACVDFRLYLPYGPVGGPVWLGQRRLRRREMVAALNGLKDRLETSGSPRGATAPFGKRAVSP